MTDNRFSGFLIGMTLGATVSVLFAPNPGKKTRRLIAEKAHRGKAFIERRGTVAAASARHAFNKGAKVVKRANGAMTGALRGVRSYVLAEIR